MGFLAPEKAPPVPIPPAAPPPPPMFGAGWAQKKPKAKSMQPTFLGTEDQPMQGQLGSKTLLGQ